MPPKPPQKPPKPFRPTSEPTKPSESLHANDLATAFSGLSISNPSTPAAPQHDAGFIGGFNLAGASSSAPALSASPGPPTMPVPHIPSPGQHSLTMQFAMQPDYNDFVSIPLPPFIPQKPPRPQSSTSPLPNTAAGLPPPTTPTTPASPTISARPSHSLTPIKHTLSGNGSTSTPSTLSTPSGKTGQVQCAGITKAGKRCTRQVKVDRVGDDSEDEEENVPRFCYQHTAEVLVPSGYYARKNGIWVQFEGKIRLDGSDPPSDSRFE